MILDSALSGVPLIERIVCVTHDKMVSVYDVMRVACNSSNPTDMFDNIVKNQSQTINLLPGANAAAFSGAKLLVRYLGGDERLIDEVRAIQDHHVSGASQGTVDQLFHEATKNTAVPAVGVGGPTISSS